MELAWRLPFDEPLESVAQLRPFLQLAELRTGTAAQLGAHPGHGVEPRHEVRTALESLEPLEHAVCFERQHRAQTLRASTAVPGCRQVLPAHAQMLLRERLGRDRRDLLLTREARIGMLDLEPARGPERVEIPTRAPRHRLRIRPARRDAQVPYFVAQHVAG